MSIFIKEVNMRVTKEKKEKTRSAIIQSARKLFKERGFDKTVTRDITTRAQIAAGTLFNYFQSKEALGMEILSEDLDLARDDYEKLKRGEESLEEDIFLYILTGLRRLAPHRNYVPDILESALSPFGGSNACEAGERVRVEHLEAVATMVSDHDQTNQLSFVAAHLYWTLYLGVLAFWAQDESENQEDTLVLLDQSLRLFVASLSSNQSQREVNHDA
jgi:AcrR family transcriptional regulator